MATNTTTANIIAKCHCGDITVDIKGKPDYINMCQCSICKRYGAEWGYYQIGEVEVHKGEGAETKKYIWGDRTVEFHFCAKCGCIMYWWPIEAGESGKEVGINTRMIHSDDLRKVERRETYVDAD